ARGQQGETRGAGGLRRRGRARGGSHAGWGGAAPRHYRKRNSRDLVAAGVDRGDDGRPGLTQRGRPVADTEMRLLAEVDIAGDVEGVEIGYADSSRAGEAA